ncbi:unnamed protein product [marine sediment metagenome]|uniref:Uncharacterized protein n=1 Tax=marine sediment metagenome TaxID=412755 RepID=X1NG51_9ZZZZ
MRDDLLWDWSRKDLDRLEMTGYRSRFEGSWGDWKRFVMGADLSRFAPMCYQLLTAKAVSLPPEEASEPVD